MFFVAGDAGIVRSDFAEDRRFAAAIAALRTLDAWRAAAADGAHYPSADSHRGSDASFGPPDLRAASVRQPRAVNVQARGCRDRSGDTITERRPAESPGRGRRADFRSAVFYDCRGTIRVCSKGRTDGRRI